MGDEDMPKYAVLITGTGEGCDYTLDCNKTWRMVEANDIDECRNIILSEYGMLTFDPNYFPDILIENLILFEIAGEFQEVTGIPEWYEEQYDQHQKQKKIDQERAPYEELKKKFE